MSSIGVPRGVVWNRARKHVHRMLRRRCVSVGASSSLSSMLHFGCLKLLRRLKSRSGWLLRSRCWATSDSASSRAMLMGKAPLLRCDCDLEEQDTICSGISPNCCCANGCPNGMTSKLMLAVFQGVSGPAVARDPIRPPEHTAQATVAGTIRSESANQSRSNHCQMKKPHLVFSSK